MFLIRVIVFFLAFSCSQDKKEKENCIDRTYKKEYITDRDDNLVLLDRVSSLSFSGFTTETGFYWNFLKSGNDLFIVVDSNKYTLTLDNDVWSINDTSKIGEIRFFSEKSTTDACSRSGFEGELSLYSSKETLIYFEKRK